MFTKQHYEVIAKAIKESKKFWQHEPMMVAGINFFAGFLSWEFSKDNPGFNPEQFAEACGIKLE